MSAPLKKVYPFEIKLLVGMMMVICLLPGTLLIALPFAFSDLMEAYLKNETSLTQIVSTIVGAILLFNGSLIYKFMWQKMS